MPGPVSAAAWSQSSDTVRPAASKTVTMTVILFARPSADLDTIPASSAYSMPQTALRTHASGSELTPFTLKVRMLKGEVMETLLYGCVTWTLGQEHFAELRTARYKLFVRIIGF